MKWNVGAKIGVGFLLSILILVVVGLITFRNTKELVATTEARRHANEVLGEIHRISYLLKDAETSQRGFVITGEDRYLEPYTVAARLLPTELAALRRLTSDNPNHQPRLVRLGEAMQAKLDELKETIELRRRQPTVNIDRGQEFTEQIRKVISEIEQEEQGTLSDRSQEAKVRASNTFNAIELGIVIAALAVLLIGYYTARNISVPLREVSRVADRIATGDLSLELAEVKRTDEVGMLLSAFQRMSVSLNAVAGRAQQLAAGDLRGTINPLSDQDALGTAFATMTGNLRQLIQEILDAVKLVTTSATGIMASTSALAAGATQTASAVSETTATVEEVKQTSHLSSQKGRVVSDRAQKAAEVALSGKRAVEETVDGMTRIRAQMDSIGESIVRLSEQSQAIGEIIAAVDDLAAQSNLLAVNASIEAAKAGEHGRGFSVVAQEVKSLADQSRQATNQVRAILSEIQKATSGAVMATEQGSKAVEAGVKQSKTAGEAIRLLSENLSEAAQASVQIAATSQEQFVGMDQVALAMENIKAASTQTVTSTRQAEDAAQALAKVGQRLKALVEKFKV